MSEPASEEAKKLHSEFVAEIHKRELSSSENFDKSVLTVSGAGLALSVGFLKDFVVIQQAVVPWALYVSWISFASSTCLTMASFLVSGRALAKQKSIAFRYYIEQDEDAFNEPNRFDTLTTSLNYWSGGLFILAMVTTTLFISLNLQNGIQMKSGRPDQTALGATVPSMQASSSIVKGLPVPAIQQFPLPVAKPPLSSPQTSSATPQNSPASTPTTP